MSQRSVQIFPAALDEASAAVRWYAERSPRAAHAFEAELDRVIDQVAAHPERFQAFEAGTRHAVLRRFPFIIVFRATPETIEILAVAHGRRRPGYWRDRI